ncbi:MAG: SGNH/GDSL hydrolase family protein [Clostridia bacterium]|nr:SGNH/GDSL hydrolase family protein [Clostridia bacterium]
MRNGMKNSTRSVGAISFVLLPLIFIIVIICLVLLVHLNIKTVTISMDNAFEFKISKQPHLKANLYQSPIITEPKYTSAQCAEKFSTARAMVIGDSTAEGLVAYGAIYDANVIWTRGRTIQYMTADLEKAISYQPDHLFLSYGANDLLSWCGNVEGYIGAYEKSISYIRSVLPNTKIYINAILPVDESAVKRDENFKHEALFNEHLHKFCLDNNITFIDNRNLLNQNDGNRVFESDGVHPRPFYYKLWANNMIEMSKI